jgi:hypothetical protein
MKKPSPILIGVIIIILIVLIWLIVSLIKNTKQLPSTEIITQETEIDILKKEALIRWQTNCEADGGTWVKDYEMCYQESIAQTLRASCQTAGGIWVEKSLIYECDINNERFKAGEWEIIDWERYQEMKQSCLDYNGEWLGGVNEACKLNGDIFYAGRWLVLNEMEDSCINEFNGQWLGGENTKCLIDNITYPGNWVQIFSMKDSCTSQGGEWLGGDNNQCQINNQVYSNQAWEQIPDMKTSCESIGGGYIGGDRFRCDWEGNAYFDKAWERFVLAPSMGELCIENSGNWNEDTKTCQGLDNDWCIGLISELGLSVIYYNDDTKSCYIN